MATGPIDPKAGFGKLVAAWRSAPLGVGQGFWHAGNTLDTCVTYLVQAKQKDNDPNVLFVSSGEKIFRTSQGIYPYDPPGPGTPDRPTWWRDDYGWWGIAFLNAVQNAGPLGVDALVDACKARADLCWRIMKKDWDANKDEKGNHLGVRNDPRPPPYGQPIANTITNVLFLVLSLRRYEISLLPGNKPDPDALATAKDVFDWFYNAPPCEDSSPTGANGLYNKQNLIRYYPSHYQDDRAWSADQGWLWRACVDLDRHDTDKDRKAKYKEVSDKLWNAVLKNVFDANGIVRELRNDYNFDIDFATGIGVFMRQFAYVNANINSSWVGQQYPWAPQIRDSAQGAWTNSDWDRDYTEYNLPSGCWYAGGTDYFSQESSAFGLWQLTMRTAAQDAFNAYMTVPPA